MNDPEGVYVVLIFVHCSKKFWIT